MDLLKGFLKFGLFGRFLTVCTADLPQHSNTRPQGASSEAQLPPSSPPPPYSGDGGRGWGSFVQGVRVAQLLEMSSRMPLAQFIIRCEIAANPSCCCSIPSHLDNVFACTLSRIHLCSIIKSKSKSLYSHLCWSLVVIFWGHRYLRLQ